MLMVDATVTKNALALKAGKVTIALNLFVTTNALVTVFALLLESVTARRITSVPTVLEWSTQLPVLLKETVSFLVINSMHKT